MTVRVVEGLPYGLILGAAFLREHESVLNFAEGGGFKPAPESPWVPLRSMAGCPKLSERKATGWKATPRKNQEIHAAILGKEATPWERFCAVAPPSAEKEPEGLTEPDTVPKKSEVVWEDDGSLQWNMRLAKEVKVGGFVSVQKEAFVTGPQPQDRQLVLVIPTQPYDMELGAELGVARGVQWWYPGNPLQCKVVNRTKTAMTIQQGVVVAKVFATNSSDTERMRLLLDRSVEKEPVPAVEGESGGTERPTGDLEEVAVDIAEANMGQLSQGCKSNLLELLREYRDRGLFPANPKVVPACHGAKLRLPLTREDCTPYAAKQRRYSPEEEAMIQSEVTKQFQTGAIRRSTSA